MLRRRYYKSINNAFVGDGCHGSCFLSVQGGSETWIDLDVVGDDFIIFDGCMLFFAFAV